MTAVLELDVGAILAEAARLRETAVKDKTYQATPIGALVRRYLDEIAFNGASKKTVDNREQILYHLAFDLAHLEPGLVVLDDLTGFLHGRWRNSKPNTKRASTTAVRVFFEWAFDNELIPSNPARRLKQPKEAETERVSHPRTLVRKLIVGQDSQRDRVAVLVLYWCGLRRNELRLVQFRHIDLANRLLTVFGKGGTVLEQNIPGPLALELERHILDRQPAPDEYLLYPYKLGRFGSYPHYRSDVTWEDRISPYTNEGIGAWWRRVVKNAGLEAFPMHEMRHTAGTHFHQQSRDLVETQHFMRHKDPATTARTYVHLDRVRAVSEVQRRMPDPLDEA